MNEDKYPLKKDLIISIIIVLLIGLITFIFQTNLFTFSPKELLGTFIGLISALLGFIITSVTLLFMFDYEKSEILMKIKRKGYDKQIYDRYIKTAIILTITLFYFIFMYVFYAFGNLIIPNQFIIFSIQIKYALILKLISNVVLFTLLTVSLIRIYRSVKLLNLILQNLNDEKK